MIVAHETQRIQFLWQMTNGKQRLIIKPGGRLDHGKDC